MVRMENVMARRAVLTPETAHAIPDIAQSTSDTARAIPGIALSAPTTFILTGGAFTTDSNTAYYSLAHENISALTGGDLPKVSAGNVFDASTHTEITMTGKSEPQKDLTEDL